MLILLGATVLVAASHMVPSVPMVRAGLCRVLGRRVYLALHSALSVGAVALLVWAWTVTDPAPSPLDLGEGAKRAAVLLMPLAFTLIAARLLRRPGERAEGIYTVTAVPGSLGMTLWAGLHLMAVSDARAAVVFAGFAAIALFALVKNRLTAPPGLRRIGWPPFAGALAGRVRVDWRGIGVAPLLWGSGAWAVLLMLHPLILGVSPWVWLS